MSINPPYTAKRKAISLGALFLMSLLLYLANDISRGGSDHQESLSYFRSFGSSPVAAVVIILSMAGAWAFALPGSIFFFIIPLMYEPVPSATIITAGSLLGGLTGYVASRYIGGPWVEHFRDNRITKFLEKHSSFATLFAIRVVPSSPHGFINYGAGLVKVPLVRFLAATGLATAIKGLIYSVAVHSAVEARSLVEALTWESVTALFGIALLALLGRWVKKKYVSENGSA